MKSEQMKNFLFNRSDTIKTQFRHAFLIVWSFGSVCSFWTSSLFIYRDRTMLNSLTWH